MDFSADQWVTLQSWLEDRRQNATVPPPSQVPAAPSAEREGAQRSPALTAPVELLVSPSASKASKSSAARASKRKGKAKVKGSSGVGSTRSEERGTRPQNAPGSGRLTGAEPGDRSSGVAENPAGSSAGPVHQSALMSGPQTPPSGGALQQPVRRCDSRTELRETATQGSATMSRSGAGAGTGVAGSRAALVPEGQFAQYALELSSGKPSSSRGEKYSGDSRSHAASQVVSRDRAVPGVSTPTGFCDTAPLANFPGGQGEAGPVTEHGGNLSPPWVHFSAAPLQPERRSLSFPGPARVSRSVASGDRAAGQFTDPDPTVARGYVHAREDRNSGFRDRSRSPRRSFPSGDVGTEFSEEDSERPLIPSLPAGSPYSSPGEYGATDDPQGGGAGLAAQVAKLLAPLIAEQVTAQVRASLHEQFPDPPLAHPAPPTPLAPPQEILAGTAGLSRPSTSHVMGFMEEVGSHVDESAQVPGPSSLDEPEDDSRAGAFLSQELVSKVTDIFISHLGFDAPSRGPQKESTSRLSSSNVRSENEGLPPLMPVDAQCFERIEALAAKKWTARPASLSRTLHFSEEDMKSAFLTPTISDATSSKIRAELGLSQGTFPDSASKSIEESWAAADTTARAGLQFSSVLLLAAESLIRAHQQLPDDPNCFSRAEVGRLVFMLGPLSRLIYDQFARVSLKSTEMRRQNVLNAFDWPTKEARASLEKLPVLGSDLFHGEFLQTLQKEVLRHKEALEASFCHQDTAHAQAMPTTSLPPVRRPRARQATRAVARRGRAGAKRVVGTLPIRGRSSVVPVVARGPAGRGGQRGARARGKRRGSRPSFPSTSYRP